MSLLSPLEIVPGVFQLRAIGSKVTAIVDGDDIVMIDAGGPGSGRMIASGLKELGLSLEQVRLIALTHYHPDHTGGLNSLAEMSTAHVAAHRLEADMLNRKVPFLSPFSSRVIARVVTPLLNPLYGTQTRVDTLVEDGDKLPFPLEIRAVHTPGHTLGSMCYFVPSRKVLVVGDALQYRFRRLSLPAILVTYDMQRARESLMKLLSLDFEVICFAHFPPLQRDAKETLRQLVDENEYIAHA